MKKVFTLFAALLTVGTLMAQTIVPTTVQKRNVLLEEFTGVGCGYCPDGHAIANQICADYEDHAWAINIHAGGYATGSGYTTTDGDGIHNEFYSQIQGYPCGVVNRGSVQSRGDWAATAADIRAQDAIVNIAAVYEFDAATSTYTMHIETYYTGNSTQDTNYLNVAVTQDNILGQQSNYGPYNTDYVEGNQYRHMHMLRELLCGQWGVEIPATQGSFFDTTIVFQVPSQISGLAIPDPADLNFIAFVTETHKNVLNAQKVIPPATTPKLSTVLAEQEADCSLQYNFFAVVDNFTLNNVHGVTLNVDGNEMTFNTVIPPFSSTEVALPSYTFTVSGDAVQNCTGTKTASMVSFINEDNETVAVNGAAKSTEYGGFKIYTAAAPFTLRFGIDAYGTEAGVQLVNQSNCSVVWSEGPWSDLNVNWNAIQYISQIPDARMKELTFSPAEAGLYILRATDSYGDGWTSTNNTVTSGMWLRNASGEIFADAWGYSAGPAFTHYDYYLNVTNAGDGSHSTVGIDEVANVNFSVYPNPATDRLVIECNDAVREINVVDMAGRTVMTLGAANEVNVSGLAAGVYMLRMITDNGMGVQKFVKE